MLLLLYTLLSFKFILNYKGTLFKFTLLVGYLLPFNCHLLSLNETTNNAWMNKRMKFEPYSHTTKCLSMCVLSNM